MNAGAAAPGHLGHGGLRREPEELATGSLRLRHRPDVGAHRRLHDLVLGHPGLQEQPTSRAGAGRRRRRHHPRRSRHEGEGLLGGAVARREELLVEVEERHQVGPVDALEHRFGADHDSLARERRWRWR